MGDNSRGLKLVAVPGGIINIDDKIALRYCECEDELGYDIDYWWEVNAGMTNGAGALEARTVNRAVNRPHKGIKAHSQPHSRHR